MDFDACGAACSAISVGELKAQMRSAKKLSIRRGNRQRSAVGCCRDLEVYVQQLRYLTLASNNNSIDDKPMPLAEEACIMIQNHGDNPTGLHISRKCLFAHITCRVA